jgi:hypothetical protein
MPGRIRLPPDTEIDVGWHRIGASHLTRQSASGVGNQGARTVPKIVVYLQVSTDEQAGYGLGLEAQLSACRATADRLDLEIACTHSDDVSSDLASGHDVIIMAGPLAPTGKAS